MVDQGLVLKNVSFLTLRHGEWAVWQSRNLPNAEFPHPSIFMGPATPKGREPTPKRRWSRWLIDLASACRSPVTVLSRQMSATQRSERSEWLGVSIHARYEEVSF